MKRNSHTFYTYEFTHMSSKKRHCGTVEAVNWKDAKSFALDVLSCLRHYESWPKGNTKISVKQSPLDMVDHYQLIEY